MAQGYLQVWQGFFSRWAKYYFRIHEDTLIFGPKRQQIQGKVHLKVAQIISIVDDPISFIIHTGTDTLRLRASSIDERVKWFKKLKKIKTNIDQQNYSKDRSSFNNDNKKTKLKMLQSIVLDICLSQAQLENISTDISSKPKNGLDKMIQKLRKYAQIIKTKAMQVQKLAKQIVKTQQDRERVSGRGMYRNSNHHQDEYSDMQQHNGTAYMSFQQNKQQKLFKVFSKKQSKFQDLRQLQKITPIQTKKSNTYNQSSTVQPFKLASSNRMISSNKNVAFQNQIKQRLIDSNPAYLELKKSLGSNKIRTSLPQKFTPQDKFPIGSVVKGSLGADLTRFALPVIVNQPISMLQKGCEQLYYTNLLDEANQNQLPQKRMLNVVSFLISQYSLSDHRTRKPFNPLLGQTFEYYDTNRQFTCICEQVSHHPPISALYCHSINFQIFDQSQAKTAFTGASIKVSFQGKSKIKLQKNSDQYIYNKCSINLNNLLMGKTQLEVTGQLQVECKKTGAFAKINFKQQGFFQRNGINQIEGQITLKGHKCFTVSGKWNESIKAIDLRDKTSFTAWTKTHVNNKDYYYFNDYTMLLNNLTKQILAQVAPTDSRLRPDQRALEYRLLDLAQSQKLRLQQKQRNKRKQNEQSKIQHKIKWFQLRKDSDGNQLYINTSNYDVDFQNQWVDYPDIY